MLVGAFSLLKGAGARETTGVTLERISQTFPFFVEERHRKWLEVEWFAAESSSLSHRPLLAR